MIGKQLALFIYLHRRSIPGPPAEMGIHRYASPSLSNWKWLSEGPNKSSEAHIRGTHHGVSSPQMSDQQIVCVTLYSI